MSEQTKKISFSFTKSTRKSTVIPATPKENSVQFIDCVEENSIKVIGEELNDKKLLVIPMSNDNSLRDSMIAAVKSRSVNNENGSNAESEKNTTENESPPIEKPLTLDELAAKEILEDLKKKPTEEESKIYAVPLTETEGKENTESTLDDYENVPVSEFGLAMLRGMGWQPNEGIGKNKQLVKPPSPVLRPKGMGLGADKVIHQKPSTNDDGSVLSVTKDSFIKVTAGQHKNLYGKVEGLDDTTGRLLVKLAIEGSVISIGEFMVMAVSKSEYTKNSNVINVIKYNEYKNKELQNSQLLNDSEKGNDQGNISDIELPKMETHFIKDGIGRNAKNNESSSSSLSPKHRRERQDKRVSSSRSPSPERRKKFRDKRVSSQSPERRKDYREKRGTSPSSDRRKDYRDKRPSTPSPDRRKVYHDKRVSSLSPERKKEYRDKRVSSPSPDRRKVYHDKRFPSPSADRRKDYRDRRVSSPSPERKKEYRERRIPSPSPERRKDRDRRVSSSPELKKDYRDKRVTSPSPERKKEYHDKRVSKSDSSHRSKPKSLKDKRRKEYHSSETDESADSDSSEEQKIKKHKHKSKKSNSKESKDEKNARHKKKHRKRKCRSKSR